MSAMVEWRDENYSDSDDDDATDLEGIPPFWDVYDDDNDDNDDDDDDNYDHSPFDHSASPFSSVAVASVAGSLAFSQGCSCIRITDVECESAASGGYNF